MCLKCERCNKTQTNSLSANSYYNAIAYDEDYDGYLCGTCSNNFAAEVEDYEISNRRRIAEDNEY
jgi:DNA-directed RNA polymerase subunit RPC12/RpoP